MNTGMSISFVLKLPRQKIALIKSKFLLRNNFRFINSVFAIFQISCKYSRCIIKIGDECCFSYQMNYYIQENKDLSNKLPRWLRILCFLYPLICDYRIHYKLLYALYWTRTNYIQHAKTKFLSFLFHS